MNIRKIIIFEQDKICLDNYFHPPFQTDDEKYDSSRIFETDNKSKQRKLDILHIPDSIFTFLWMVQEKYIALILPQDPMMKFIE